MTNLNIFGVYMLNFFGFLISKEIAIELIRVVFTALIGFITFKIYQMYKNKKDNSKLYIQMIKLEREFKVNLDIIRTVINVHSEHDKLKEMFVTGRENDVLNLYSDVDWLSSFTFENVIYEGREFSDVEIMYIEKPYEAIRALEYLKKELEYNGEEYFNQIEEIDLVIKNYEEISIYNELEKIEEKTMRLLTSEQEISCELNYLYRELKKFNALETKDKARSLNEYMTTLLNDENEFSDSMKLFRRFKTLQSKINKPENTKKTSDLLTVKFDLWEKLEMELLGVYNPEIYLKLDEYYHKNHRIEIGMWEIDKSQNLQMEMSNILDGNVKYIKNKLNKTLSKTNWLFRGI